MSLKKMHSMLFESGWAVTTGFSLLATLLAFGAGWVNHQVNQFSGLWWLSVIVIVATGLYAIRFWFLLAAIMVIIIIPLWILCYFIAYPW